MNKPNVLSSKFEVKYQQIDSRALGWMRVWVELSRKCTQGDCCGWPGWVDIAAVVHFLISFNWVSFVGQRGRGGHGPGH